MALAPTEIIGGVTIVGPNLLEIRSNPRTRNVLSTLLRTENRDTLCAPPPTITTHRIA